MYRFGWRARGAASVGVDAGDAAALADLVDALDFELRRDARGIA